MVNLRRSSRSIWCPSWLQSLHLVRWRFNLNTKTILLVNVLSIVGLCIRGFIGIWPAHAGFKTRGEVWAYPGLLWPLRLPVLPAVADVHLGPGPAAQDLPLLESVQHLGHRERVRRAVCDVGHRRPQRRQYQHGVFAFLLPFTVLGVGVLWLVDPVKAVFEAREYLGDEARALQ